MLAQHLADVDADVDGRVLLELSDLDRFPPGAVEDGPPLLVAERLDRIPDGRIGGDAAAEAERSGVALDLADLPHEIDVRHALKVLLRAGRGNLNRDFSDHADDQGFAALDFDEFSDRNAGAVQAARPLAHEGDADPRAADGMDKAPRPIAGRGRLGLISNRIGPKHR